jgi:hypothetical protein
MVRAAQQPRSATNGYRPACHRFTVQQYRQMVDQGILGENDRVELLDGWIVDKMTHNPPHDACISLVKDEIEPRLPRDWMLRIQSAITLSTSEPEPDFAVVKRPARRYSQAHPRPADIGMLIEVAESSLLEDREYKSILYAQDRIPIYWIVNLIDRQVEVYTEPRGGKTPGYRQRKDYAEDETIPLIVAGRKVGAIAVKDLLQ